MAVAALARGGRRPRAALARDPAGERVARRAARPAARPDDPRARGRHRRDRFSRRARASAHGAADHERPASRRWSAAAERRRRGRSAQERRVPRARHGRRLASPTASVDGVLSRFGYILEAILADRARGDPPRAPAGGRFAFAVWAERAQNRWMTVPAEVMVERGHLAPPGADEQALSERRQPDRSLRSCRRRLRSARDRGAAGRLSLRRRRRALAVRQRAPRAGLAGARRAARGRTRRDPVGDRGANGPSGRRLRALRREPRRRHRPLPSPGPAPWPSG